MTADHSALIARLEAATGPSRELDAEIMFDCYAEPVGREDDGGPSGYLWQKDNASWNLGIRFPGKDRAWLSEVRNRVDGETLVIWRDNAWVLMNAFRVRPFTSSLDAALTLVPAGHDRELHIRVTKGEQSIAFIESKPEVSAAAATPAIALCIAALRALSEKQDG